MIVPSNSKYDETPVKSHSPFHSIYLISSKFPYITLYTIESYMFYILQQQRLRLLENRLNKAELKHNEALTIQRTYNQIKAHLLQESLSYSNRLDELEKQIEISNEELKKLKVINKDAFVAKENASNEFSKFEDKVYK